jgi:Holliday junction resolvase RusA-like endonuclease
VIQTFTMPSLPPSKKNSKRILQVNKRGGGKRPIIASQAGYKTWETETACYMRLRLKPVAQASIRLDFALGDKRRRDMTNMSEGIMDALVVAGILPDDSCAYVPLITLVASFGPAHKTTVTIEEIK